MPVAPVGDGAGAACAVEAQQRTARRASMQRLPAMPACVSRRCDVAAAALREHGAQLQHDATSAMPSHACRVESRGQPRDRISSTKSAMPRRRQRTRSRTAARRPSADASAPSRMRPGHSGIDGVHEIAGNRTARRTTSRRRGDRRAPRRQAPAIGERGALRARTTRRRPRPAPKSNARPGPRRARPIASVAYCDATGSVVRRRHRRLRPRVARGRRSPARTMTTRRPTRRRRSQRPLVHAMIAEDQRGDAPRSRTARRTLMRTICRRPSRSRSRALPCLGHVHDAAAPVDLVAGDRHDVARLAARADVDARSANVKLQSVRRWRFSSSAPTSLHLRRITPEARSAAPQRERLRGFARKSRAGARFAAA